jgi:hypothetical protein
MSTIGRDLAVADPPIIALIVYNSNPVAVAPGSRSVAAGFAREDLFTVVLEHFRTDTADYADYVLPATTQLEHTDVHKTYGHLYMLANNAAIAPLGEALPNSEIFPPRGEDGLRRAVLPRDRRRDRGRSVQRIELRLADAEEGRLAEARPAEDLCAVRARRLSDEERQVRDLFGESRPARPRSRAGLFAAERSPTRRSQNAIRSR